MENCSRPRQDEQGVHHRCRNGRGATTGLIPFRKGEPPFAGSCFGEHFAPGQGRPIELYGINFFARWFAPLPGKCRWEREGFPCRSRWTSNACLLDPATLCLCPEALE